MGKIRGKHGFYYTFKCICCTKIRVSHLTFFTSLGAFTFITPRCEHQRVHNNKWHADHSKTQICFFVVKRRWKLIVRPIVLNVSMFELNHSLQNLLLCSDSTYFLHKILGFQYLFPEKILPNQRLLASGKFLAPTLRMPGGQRRRVLAQQGGRIPGFQTWEIHLI